MLEPAVDILILMLIGAIHLSIASWAMVQWRMG